MEKVYYVYSKDVIIGLNKILRNTDIEILTLLLTIYNPIIVNQPQAIAETLSFSTSSIGNRNTSNNMTQIFHGSYEMLINESRLLTQSYQKEIGKWESKEYDNKTMVSITENYLPKFQKLVNRAEALQPTTAKDFQAQNCYIKSLHSELESYKHFRNFLATGNPAEDDRSTQLLSDALRYEANSFAAFNNATNNG